MTGRGRWRLYPRLLLRRAGFDAELLTRLADREVEQAAAVYRHRVAELEAVRLRLLRDEIPKAVAVAAAAENRSVLRILSTIRRRVGRSRPLPVAAAGLPADGLATLLAEYGNALDAENQAADRLAAALREEQVRRRSRVAEVLADPRVTDALLQLAPSFYDQVGRPRSTRGAVGAKERALHRRVYLYSQRLAVKNETTSFFGPLVHGRIDREVAGISLGPETDRGVHRLVPSVAFWAVCAAARTMAGDARVTGRLPVSRVPACGQRPGGLVLPGGRELPLSPTQCAVVEAVDGSRTVEQIAALVGQPVAAVAALVRRLERAGALRVWPEPSSTTPQPLDELLDTARRYAAHTDWPDRLARLRDLADGYADAQDAPARRVALDAIEAEFAGLTGISARRNGGRMYADRSVVSLDAEGDQSPVRVGATVAADWERQLGPVLDVAAHFGVLHRRACQRACVELLRRAGRSTMPYQELIGQLAARETPVDEPAPVAEFQAELAALLRRNDVDGTVNIDPVEFAALAPATSDPHFASPDVMIERHPDGSHQLVLGELHPYVFAWGSQGQFSGDQDGLLAPFEADLDPWGGPRRLATVIRRRQHKGLVAEWFPGRFVEVTAVATRDRSRVLSIGELSVTLTGDDVQLCAPDGELVLYAGDEDHPHLAAFAAPTPRLPVIRFGDRAPRVFVGDLLVQRTRWWIRADALRPAAEESGGAFRLVQRLRARHGLPRFVFAHLPGEPKPICVDLDAPLAVQTLVAMAEVVPAGAELSLVEMRPAVDRLWLRHHGRPVSSEFRLALRRVVP